MHLTGRPVYDRRGHTVSSFLRGFSTCSLVKVDRAATGDQTSLDEGDPGAWGLPARPAGLTDIEGLDFGPRVVSPFWAVGFGGWREIAVSAQGYGVVDVYFWIAGSGIQGFRDLGVG